VSGEAAVFARGLTRRFGDFTAVASASTWKCMPGEIFGFLGANGAGKTTAIKHAHAACCRPAPARPRVAGCRCVPRERGAQAGTSAT
jgi:ABC-2 type transport system ATP-binding protein